MEVALGEVWERGVDLVCPFWENPPLSTNPEASRTPLLRGVCEAFIKWVRFALSLQSLAVGDRTLSPALLPFPEVGLGLVQRSGKI